MRGHLPARDHGVMDPAPAPYLIRINGHLGATMLSAFLAMAPHHHGAHTVLTGLLERSALYGVGASVSLREGAAPVTSAPVRDPLADHLLAPRERGAATSFQEVKGCYRRT
jgi:hypothetical protein